MPEFLTLALLFLLGAAAASLGNAAAYEWAWNRRRVSPWQPTPEGVSPRGWLDCVPIVGWLRLRRDSTQLGGAFWLRPLIVEVLFGATLAGLWWWEVSPVTALVAAQPEAPWPVNGYPAWTPYVLHAALAWLMLVASLIDLDEKTIPDEVTVSGTLVGLVLATLLPMGHLPNVEERAVPPAVGVALRGADGGLAPGLLGAPLYAEPVHVDAPNEWPDGLNGGPNARGALALGLGCFLLWCVALTTRVWRTRHGWLFGLGVMLRRVLRDLRARPLREITIGGVLAITCVWFTGGAAWQGLLTALVGMIGAGSIVWAVRIIGTAALRREAMGFGDVTLMMMVGVYIGWQAGMMVFFLAPFAALLIGVGQLLLGRGDEIPYGPFLCLATCFVVVQWGWLWPRSEALFALGAAVPIVLIVCLAMLGLMLAVWRQIKLRLLGMSEDWTEE